MVFSLWDILLQVKLILESPKEKWNLICPIDKHFHRNLKSSKHIAYKFCWTFTSPGFFDTKNSILCFVQRIENVMMTRQQIVVEVDGAPIQ